MHDDRLREFRASLALRHCKGLGPRTWRVLLDYFGSAREAVDSAGRWRGLGLVRQPVVDAFRARKWERKADAEQEKAEALGADIVLWSDPEYPPLLRMIPDPPLHLYCRGRLELLAGPSVAIVGSRKYVPEGMLAASRIGRELSEAGVTIVSGMAWGIDREAHVAGLNGSGSSVAVLGTGLDRVYPSRNVDIYKRLSDEGLVISEFAPGTRPEASNFPVRNRIVSGLSLGVVVAQAAARSGSRITARLALEQGREVYAYAGQDGSPAFEGCHALADEGAMTVTTAEQILADLAPRMRQELERVREQPATPRGRTRQAVLDIDAPSPSAPKPANRSRRDTARPTGTMTTAREEASSPAASSRPVPPPPQTAVSSDPDEQAILTALADGRQVHIDVLGRELGWDAARLSRVLLMLEVSGGVRQWPGMQYSLA